MAFTASTSGRTILVNLTISLTVTIFVLLVTQDVFLEFPPFKRAELSLIDLRFKRRGVITSARDSSKIIIVEISQESFRSLPEPWPWPKRYYARLIRNLNRAGAKAIGLDIVFSSNDSRNQQDDADFRRAVQEAGNVVLAGKIDTENRNAILREQHENYGNVYIESPSLFGLVNTRSDEDGVLRRTMPFIYDEAQKKRIPTYSMAILNFMLQQPQSYTAEVGIRSFRYAMKDIPKYDERSFLINYYGPSGTFRRIKFADVIDDQDFRTLEEDSLGVDINTFDDTTSVPSFDHNGSQPAGYLYNGTFANKIVLVGSTEPEAKDLFPVSIAEGRQEGDNQMYGVEIHANVIQNVLNNDFIYRQPFWITALVIFGLSMFTFVFTAALKSIKTRFSSLIEILGVAIIISELLIIYWGSIKLFNERNYLTDMTSPFVAVIVCYIGSTVFNYVTERKQKVLIRSMFRRYVSPTVVDELIAHPDKLTLGGERKELTVFFSDIERFTNISEKMPPEQLVSILNEYLAAMTDLILVNDGTLDKYEGDAIVAFWGAPVPQSDHALRACKTAVGMQKFLADLRTRWEGENKPLLNVRIGISTGEMVVGNMGGTDRFDYTVIGDCVNLGARLESANKQYHTYNMISDRTYQHAKAHVIVRELDLLVVAGKTEPIKVFELVGMAGDTVGDARLRLIEHYTKGLALYRERKWQEAINSFERALETVPDDYPTQLHLERAFMYRSSPPPDDWTGVFVLRTK